MWLAKYLGAAVSTLIKAEFVNGWAFERWVDDESDPPVVGYSFVDCGLQMNCDLEAEIIRSLFLEKEMHGGILLSEVPFNSSRSEVRARFGRPSRSGDKVTDAILGDFGPWDRFQLPGYAIHIEYKLDSAGIKKITLMRNDVLRELG